MQETKDVLKLFCALVNFGGVAMEDGKISIGDLPQALPIVLAIPAAVSGLKGVLPEWQQMTDEQKADLKVFVETELDIPQDAIEGWIEAGLKVAIDLAALFAKK